MSMQARIAKLEARTRSLLPVWCDDGADVPATIDAMIADGELTEADRHRCVHWSEAVMSGRHEAALLETGQ